MKRLILFLGLMLCAGLARAQNPTPITITDKNGNTLTILGATSGSQVGNPLPVVLTDVNGNALILSNNGAGVAITTVSGLATLSPKSKGTVAAITDGTSGTDCTVGGGSTVAVCQYNGTTWAAVGGGGSGAITNQVLNALSLGGSSATAVSGTVANGKTGQVLQSTNAAAPTFVSPGLPWGNGSAAVTATPYAVACDSGTAVADRGTTILFQSGASVINLPDPTAAGCTGNFAVSLYDDGAGTLTVNRGGTSTINVMDGTMNTDGATSFMLATGQGALCNANAAGTIWACRKLAGAATATPQMLAVNITSATTPSGTQFLTFAGTDNGLQAAAATAAYIAPAAGKASQLHVRISAAEGAAATLAFTLTDGATQEAVTCTVPNSGTTCSDLTHSFSFAAGDSLTWQTVQTGTGTSARIYVSFEIQ